MKLSFCTFVSIATIFCALSLAGQDQGSIEALMKKQFYGNRLKAETILLNGAFRYSGFQNEDVDGFIGEIGGGLGLGISEHFALTAAYHRTKDFFSGLDVNGERIETYLVGHTLNVGIRYLPNTMAGFLQLYTGADFFTQSRQYPVLGNGFLRNFNEDEILGLNIPVGVIFWISTWMAVTVEPVNLTLSRPKDKAESEGQLSFGFSTLNPQFGFTFALLSKKPN